MRRISSIFLFLLLTLPVLAEPVDTFSTVIRSRIDQLLQNDIFDRTQLGLYVYDLTSDMPLYDQGRLQCMRPASCEKILTAVSALTYLGCDYNYKTSLYLRKSKSNGAVASESNAEESVSNPDTVTHYDVIVKGGFDPMLGADDLRAFAQALHDKGITHITGDIICDVSMKDTTALGWGWCWDDEMQPLTPLLYRGKDTFRSQFAEALKNAEITFSGNFRNGRVPSDASLLITRTHTIDQILQPMMKKSDNLYAESLFYQLAAKSGKTYATYKEGAAKVNQFIDLCGHVISHYQVADGSGLSLYNYLTPELLVDALRYVFKHEQLFNHLYPSLPIMGRDGTLKNRCKGSSAQDRVHAKTGTVTGVSSLAGYATAPNGHQLAFAIINQGIRHTSTGRNFQDRICKALTQPLDLLTIEPDSISEPSVADTIVDQPVCE